MATVLLPIGKIVYICDEVPLSTTNSFLSCPLRGVVMNEPDAILLATFDDEPQPLPPGAAAEPRPANRPRPCP